MEYSYSPAVETPLFSFQPVALEDLEPRLLMANAAPVFATALYDGYWMPEKTDSGGNYVLNASSQNIFTARTIGIDGSDANGDALTITAVSDNPAVNPVVYTAGRYARLHFVGADGAVIGDVVVQLLEDRAAAGAAQFITLATRHVNADGSLAATGSPFYTNVLVHRVIPGFMIQTGDAAKGDGTGGSPLPDIANPATWPDLSFAGAGVLAYANAGANTSNSQFFITDAPTAWLNDNYIIFGQVISGQNVVQSIINVPRDTDNNRPYDPPILQSVQIFSSTQDATVTLHAADGFAGTAHVTVTLDDGHGGLTQKVLTVRPLAALANRPTITAETVQSMNSGVVNTISPIVVDDGGLPVTVTATPSNSLVTASVDPTTHQITLTAPSSFSGLVTVRLTAVEAGWTDLTPSVKDLFVYVHSTIEAPLVGRDVDSYLGTDKYALGSAVSGNKLYVVNDAQGITQYDISDPTNPTKTAEILTGLSGARDIKVVGNTAFVADTYGGFKAYNVGVAGSITQIGSIATAGAAVGFVISGNTAWIADYTGGVTAIDITTPAAMAKVGTTKQVGGITMQYIAGVAINGNRLYLGDLAGGVVILDITNRAAPTLLGAFGAGGSVFGIDVVGTTLYVADRNGALRIWDVALPATPKLLSSLLVAGAWQVKVSGTLAIISSSGGFVFADVSNPKKPRGEYTYSAPDAAGIPAIWGPDVAVPLGVFGFVIVRGVRTLANGTAVFPTGAFNSTFTVANGTLQVFTSNVGYGSVESIVVPNGVPTTTLTISTPAGTVLPVGGVTVSGSLKSLTAATTDITGDFSLTGSLETVKLHNLSGGNSFDIAATAPNRNLAASLTATFAQVSDLDFSSAIPVKTLTVESWNDLLPADDSLSAPSIGTLTVKGNFAPDLNLTGAGNPKLTLTKAAISGNLPGSTWTITGPVGTLSAASVGEALAPWTLTGPTALGKTTFGNVVNAELAVAGAVAALSAKQWSDGSIDAATLASLSISGLTGVLPGNFGADLTLTGNLDPAKPTSGAITVAGNLNGEWDIAGKVGAVTAKGAVGTAPAPWVFHNATAVTSITLGDVVNADVTVEGGTGAVSVKRWTDGAFHADTVASFKTTGLTNTYAGDFAADLTLDGSALPTKATSGAITIAGALTGGTWDLTGKIGALSITRIQAALALTHANLTSIASSATPLVTVLVGGLPAYVNALDGANTHSITFSSLAKWPTTKVNE